MHNNPLYCSTGTIISRYNNYDYTLMYKVLPPLLVAAGYDGCEFMMLPFFYDKLNVIASEMTAHDMKFPVIHAEKEIGTLISDESPESDREALRLFEINCEMGARLGASRIVLHLWGGRRSDCDFPHNLLVAGMLLDIAVKYDLQILIENVPCVAGDPILHWNELAQNFPSLRYIYDTRFGEFHRENDRIAKHPLFTSGLVNHIHISDFVGEEREFTRLRPILHPGDGQIDFPAIFSLVRAADYRGSITLESPVGRSDGSLDTEQLLKSMMYVKSQTE